jgi:hypothetical protein
MHLLINAQHRTIMHDGKHGAGNAALAVLEQPSQRSAQIARGSSSGAGPLPAGWTVSARTAGDGRRCAQPVAPAWLLSAVPACMLHSAAHDGIRMHA